MKKIFISSAITPPATPPTDKAGYKALQLTMCHMVENLPTYDDDDNEIDVGCCDCHECDSCILGEVNFDMFKDWCKPNTITLACDGCIHITSVYCEHCLRGNTVKDFYQNEITQSSQPIDQWGGEYK